MCVCIYVYIYVYVYLHVYIYDVDIRTYVYSENEFYRDTPKFLLLITWGWDLQFEVERILTYCPVCIFFPMNILFLKRSKSKSNKQH